VPWVGGHDQRLHKGRGMGGGGGGDVRGPSTVVRPLDVRPLDVQRVATGNWVWTSVQGRGTDGRSGAPAFVPGRSAARAGAARRARRHASA
jgi:hypothetical protein